MAIGTNTDNKFLWKFNVKVKTDGPGFTETFKLADMVEADALTGAIDIAAEMKKLLPTNAEIFYASLCKADSKRDGVVVDGALGVGTYNYPAVGEDDPVPSLYDNPRTALLVRFDGEDGGFATRKIGPLPDGLVEGGVLTTPIASIKGVQVAAPIALVGTPTWFQIYTRFLKCVMFYTHLLKGKPNGNGNYTYYKWRNAYVLRVSTKKGGRAFTE